MISRRSDFSLLVMTLVLVAAFFTALSVSAPRAHATAALTLTTLTATTSPVYANTGLATTSRATTGDAVKFLVKVSGTPLITPTINILGMGTTSFTGGAGTNWSYSTTSVSLWTEGNLTYYIAFGNVDGTATTTVSQANVTAPNVYFDLTAPTLASVSWSDTDSSTQFSGTDTLTFTFSETMATTTITTATADSALGLTNSHTFGTAANGFALSWNTAGNVLTMTLGSDVTADGTDTVNPSTAVKDSVGIADATVSAITLPDTTAPANPTGLADTSFTGVQHITLAASGSTSIRYTTNGTTPTCSTGTLYTGSDIILSSDATVKAIACDQASNASAVVSATYTQHGSGSASSSGGGGGGSNASSNTSAHVGGLSTSQINSVVQLLHAFGADASVIANVQASLAGRPGIGDVVSAAVHLFQTDRAIGSVGDDVKALQQYLDGHSFSVAASGPGALGSETTTFGSLTKAALAAFQASVGITPAAGYLGPKTRAYINAHP